MDGADTVGTEVHDPEGWSCQAVFECRYSDAAIIRADVDTADILYAIARPVGAVIWGIGGNGSKLIDEAAPTIPVGGKRTYTLVGLGVYKIGQTTGWTGGHVQQTCHDFYRLYDWKAMVCADWADYGAGHGDSGSPVFTFVDGQAIIAGLHVGRNTSDLAYFSSMGNIETDLGTLNVTPNGAPPPGPSVAITGPSDVGAVGTYEWQAVISNATAPYTYSWYMNSSLVGTNQTLSLFVDGSGSFTLELHTNYGDTFHYVEWTGDDPPCCDDLRVRVAPPKRP